MANATPRAGRRDSVPLRYKPVKWSITEPIGTVHILASFSEIHDWFVANPDVDREVCTIRRNGSVVQQGLRTP